MSFRVDGNSDVESLKALLKVIDNDNAQKRSYKPMFENRRNTNGTSEDVSDGKVKTEVFKFEIMSKLDTSKSDRPLKNIRYYLGKLIETAQTLNGARNLKPNGTAEQNKMYSLRMEEIKAQMKDYAEFVGSGLSVVQDSKNGLYKLCINNQFYDIPERKVEIGTVDTEDRIELMPEIVD